MIETVTGPSGGRDLVLIAGELPTEQEWQWIGDQDLWVNVLQLPGAATSLQPLLPWERHIKHLTINSSSCSDLRDLPSFSNLESLAVGGRITRLPRGYVPQGLRDFAGPYSGFEELIAGSPLARIKVALNSKPLGAVTPTVRELIVTSARQLTTLDAMADLSHLRGLVIHGATDLDVAAIVRLRDLTSLMFENCTRLGSAGSIAGLPRLKSLILEDIQTIDGLENPALLKMPVRVIGKHPFDKQFRERVGSNWMLPPGSEARQKG